MTAAWMKSVAARRAKRVATVDATPSESSRNEFAIQNDCPRKARFKYLVRSKSFVITTARNGFRNWFWQSQATNVHGVGRPRPNRNWRIEPSWSGTPVDRKTHVPGIRTGHSRSRTAPSVASPYLGLMRLPRDAAARRRKGHRRGGQTEHVRRDEPRRRVDHRG